MKKILAVLILFTGVAWGQGGGGGVNNPSIIQPGSSPSGNSCGTQLPLQIYSGTLYTCSGGSWTAVGGSGSMTWPLTPGIPVCTGTPCTAWGTTLTKFGSAVGSPTSSDPGATAEVPMVADGSHGIKPSASGALGTGAFVPSLSLLKGTYTDGDWCSYTASGTVLHCDNAAPSIYTLQVGGSSLSAGDTVNLNNTTPAAGSNGVNVQFQTSKSSTTDSVSAEIVGDGTATHYLSGAGTWTTPAGGSSGAITGLSSLTQFDAYYSSGANTYTLAEANSTTTMPAIGIASLTTAITYSGVVTNAGWSFTPGTAVWLSSTSAGALVDGTDGMTCPAATIGSGNWCQFIGIAQSATSLLVNPAPRPEKVN